MPNEFLSTALSAETTTVAGHLDGLDDEGRLLFRPEGQDAAFPVTIGVELSDAQLVKAARTGRRALVLPRGEASPVLIALLRERVGAEARDAGPGELEVRMDGETLVLRAEEEIELRCGRSRLKLRKDGRVMLNGAHIVSASSGPNRIKGASVALN